MIVHKTVQCAFARPQNVPIVKPFFYLIISRTFSTEEKLGVLQIEKLKREYDEEQEIKRKYTKKGKFGRVQKIITIFSQILL